MQYKELATRMEEGSVVKAVCGDYEEINSPNRGTCDYFIVDRIEEIINKYKAEIEPQKSEEDKNG